MTENTTVCVIVCTGVGPWLKVFSEREELLCEEVLKGKRIHGIHTGRNMSFHRGYEH